MIYVTGVVMTGLLIMIVEEQEKIYIPQREDPDIYSRFALWLYMVVRA